MDYYQQCDIDPQVFRAYDIRGVIGEQLNENSFYSIGKAISYQLKELNRTCCYLGHDGRLTSESLAKALRQGLLDSGVDVIDLGLIATPMMYFATHQDQAIDSGLMITGSHNPSQYNGIKMVLAGKTLSKEPIQSLYKYVSERKNPVGAGKYQTLNITDAYIQRITQDIHIARPLKIAVDSGNGMAGPFIPQILEKLGCEVIPLYCDVDGKFPNHHPDPTVEDNLIDLKNAVAQHQADIGLGFDGDADRIGVITNDGTMICPDRILMLYAQEILKRKPGATIVYDVKCSSNLEKVVLDAGGIPFMCPTGHSIVKGIMKSKNADLAGEMSGHIFFKDRWYGFDDAMYSACRLLEIISNSPQSSSAQFAAIPNSINTPELKIYIDDELKFKFMDAFCKQELFTDATIITIDGVRAEFTNGWGLIRASNTTPCLVARFEADDEESLAIIQQKFKRALLRLDASLEIPF